MSTTARINTNTRMLITRFCLLTNINITKIILTTNKRMTGVEITKTVKAVTMPIAMRMRRRITTRLVCSSDTYDVWILLVARIMVAITIRVTTGRSYDTSGGCGVPWRLQGGGTQEATGSQGSQQTKPNTKNATWLGAEKPEDLREWLVCVKGEYSADPR